MASGDPVLLSRGTAEYYDRKIEELSRQIKNLESIVGGIQPGRNNALRILKGKTDASHSKGATGTISIWNKPEASEVDSTDNITGVHNRFADLDSGKWVFLVQVNGTWELIAAEC